MKTMKKSISILLLICMLISLFPTAAFAEPDGEGVIEHVIQQPEDQGTGSEDAEETDLEEVDSTDDQKKTFTVKFCVSDNDEEKPFAVQEVKEGEKAAKPKQDPEKVGYEFVGWFIDADNEYDDATEYDFETPVTADIILKAHWSEIQLPQLRNDPENTSKPFEVYDDNDNLIGSFDSLEDAYKAVTSGTIKLTADYADNGASFYDYSTDRVITIDLGGHTLTHGGTYRLALLQGDVTLINGTVKAEDYTSTGSNLFEVQGGGTLTVVEAELDAGNGTVLYVNNATVYFLSGTISGKLDLYAGAVNIDGGELYGNIFNRNADVTLTGGVIYGNYTTQGGTSYNGLFTVNGGTITAEGTAISLSSGSVKIESGNVISTSSAAIYRNTYGNIAISGGTIAGTRPFSNTSGATGRVSISGGAFNTTGKLNTNNASGYVTGGIFKAADIVDSKYLAEGYYVMPNTDDNTKDDYPYMVAKGIAEIGETKYESLEAAFAAAVDGVTITVLADCSGNGIKAPQGKFATGVTVDFDGHIYSTGTETQAFQLLKDNKITFKNGTIYSEKAKMLVQNYSDLTLDGMTLTLNNANYASAYTLSNNNGNVVIKDSTINANEAGGFAFDVCRYSSYPYVHVEVTGESKINGNIEVYASGSDAKDGLSLTVNGGTINGDLVLDPTVKPLIDAGTEKAVIQKAEDVTLAVSGR